MATNEADSPNLGTEKVENNHDKPIKLVDNMNRNEGEDMANLEEKNESVSDGQNKSDQPPSVFKMPLLGPRLAVKNTFTAKAFSDDSKEASTKETSAPSSITVDAKQSPEGNDSDDSPKPEPVLPQPKKEATKLLSLSPAERIKQQSIPIPYKEPSWGGIGDEPYRFEVVKNGTVIETLDISSKSFHVFGRLPSCDFPMEHPSLSRYHTVVQYCSRKNELHDIGWYLYDLDSTHGTWINKTRVKPRVYNRLRVGYVVKFGGSTRLHILQGPEEDADEESELTITEMKEQRERQKKEAEVLKAAELAQLEEKSAALQKANADEGCMWGMDQEAATDDTTENPFATLDPPNEELYLDDPKKTLRGFYEREGLDLPDYKVDGEGHGKYRCALELPVDGPNGEPIIAEATVSGKKKEAVAACALEACRILDRMGELRKSHHESRKRKAKDWAENDYYDSDEDTFLDRTGDIEKKRQQRMKRTKAASNQKAQSYKELKSQLDEVEEEILSIQKRLDEAKANAASYEDADGIDALDAFMDSIKSGAMDTKTKMSLKKQLFGLKTEQMRLIKLANIAKPPDLPPLKSSTSPGAQGKAKTLPMFGKMRGPAIPKRPTPKVVPVQQTTSTGDDDMPEVEEEEEEEEENSVKENSDDVVKKEEDMDVDPVKPENEMSKKELLVESDSAGKSVPEKSAEKDASSSKSSIQDRIQRLLGPSKPKDTEKEETTKLDKKCDSFKEGQEKELREEQKDELLDEQKVSQVEVKKKRIRQRGPKFKAPKEEDVYETNDPLYATWMPPQGQSGDGKTHLNEKFGY